jgi:nucleoside triphosphatase
MARVIAVGIVQNEKGQCLICKKPVALGVFPGQWGLPGGGIEDGETIEISLRRELREEVGLEVQDIQPLFFTDGLYRKYFPDGSQQEIYMIFLVFSCKAIGEEVKLNPEFIQYAWVDPATLPDYDLNSATIKTFQQVGLI